MNLQLRSRPSQAFTRLLVALTFLLLVFAGAAPRSAVAAINPAPVDLEFDGTDNSTVLNTFLNTTLPGTQAPNSNVTLNTTAPGTLSIVSSAGDLAPFGTNQDNALGFGYDSLGSYTIGVRLLKPAFAGPFQSAGIYIGKLKDPSNAASPIQYIRYTVGRGSKGSSGERLELDVLESNGKLRSSIIPLPAGTIANIANSLDLFLNIDHAGNGKISALYRIDSDNANAGQLATSRSFPRWLRQGNSVSVFAGVITTNRGAATPITASYDWFRLTDTAQAIASVSGTKTVDKDGVPPGPSVNPSDTLTYTINVTNNGAPTTVNITDQIPADTTYVAASVNTVASGATFNAANNRIELLNKSLAAGAQVTISYQVKINAAPLQSSTILNTASLTYGTNTTPALLSAATTVGATPDLSDSIYNASPAAIGPNGVVTYSLNLLNDGTATANGATAQLSIPSGTTLVPNSATASSGSLNIDPSLTTLSWSAASPLAVGSVITVTFGVNVGNSFTNGTVLSSNAILQATGTLPNIVTAQALYTVATSIGGINSVDKAHASPGDALTYVLTVTNTSGATVTGLQVADPIPQDTTYNSGLSATAGTTASYDSATNRVLWSIPTLPTGQSVNLTFAVLINQLPLHSAIIANSAVLTAPGTPQSLLNASTIVDGVADLSHSVYTANPTSVKSNGTITYTLNLLNDGGAAAINATAELTIPVGLNFVAGSASATSGSLNVNTNINKVVWTATSPLPSGSVTKITFQAKLNGTRSGPYISTASMKANGLLPAVKSAQSLLVQTVPTKRFIYLPLLRK